MQVKTTTRYHYTLFKMAVKFKNRKTPNAGEDVGLLLCCWWDCQWKTVWHFLLKLKMDLSFGPPIAHLGIYPREIKLIFTQITVHKYFFIMVHNWKQARCPLMGE